MVKAQQCMVAVRQKWQRAAVLLDWPLADSVPSVSLWPESQNIVNKYVVPLATCFIAGQAELWDHSYHRVFPSISTYYRASPQHTQSFHLRIIGVFYDSYSPFP